MKIGLIYEITGNPYFSNAPMEFSNKISEYVYPSEINDICKSFEYLGLDYKIIDGPQELISSINKGDLCDLYFNKSIGFKGLERKIAVPSILLRYNLPIVGSSAYCMTLARHKFHTNRLLKGMGFNVPNSWYVCDIRDIPMDLSFPVIIKPNEESDSLGITESSVYTSHVGILEHIEYLLKTFNQPIIIEEFIKGEEWKMAVIGNGIECHTYGGVNSLKNGKSMFGTLQTREDILHRTLSYENLKDSPLYSQSSSLAAKIHRYLGLNDYSRCDFRLQNNQIYCMEVSTHPYIADSEDSSFIKAAKQSLGYYNNIMEQLIKESCKRNGIQW